MHPFGGKNQTDWIRSQATPVGSACCLQRQRDTAEHKAEAQGRADEATAGEQGASHVERTAANKTSVRITTFRNPVHSLSELAGLPASQQEGCGFNSPFCWVAHVVSSRLLLQTRGGDVGWPGDILSKGLTLPTRSHPQVMSLFGAQSICIHVSV